jgi:hypothetical protein
MVKLTPVVVGAEGDVCEKCKCKWDNNYAECQMMYAIPDIQKIEKESNKWLNLNLEEQIKEPWIISYKCKGKKKHIKPISSLYNDYLFMYNELSRGM